MRLQPEHEPLANPGVCILCETSPVRDVTKVVDVERQFDPPVKTTLSGRKYVCENCVADLAAVLGFEKSSEILDTKVKLEQARRILADFKDRVAGAAGTLQTQLSDASLEIPVVDARTAPVASVGSNEGEADATLTDRQEKEANGES